MREETAMTIREIITFKIVLSRKRFYGQPVE